MEKGRDHRDGHSSFQEKRCKKCDGQGVILFTKDGLGYSKICDCVYERRRARVLGERFKDADLKTMKARNEKQAKLIALLKKQPMNSYYIFGELNSGKSYIAAGLYNYVSRNYTRATYYARDKEIKAVLRKHEMQMTDGIMRDLKYGRIKMFFWDDIGKVVMKDFVRQEYFSLIDELYRREIPLVVTSNFSLTELADETLLGGAITSRIERVCNIIELNLGGEEGDEGVNL